MRPALLRGLTVALLAVSAAGVLRLPIALLGPPDGGRVDLVAPLTVPSHVVRLRALPPQARPAEKPKPRPKPAARALPPPVAQPTARATAPPARPAAPRTRSTPPVTRVIRAEPSTQLVAVAPAPTPDVAPAAPVETPPAAAPLPVAVPVAATVPVVASVERRSGNGKEKSGKARHGKGGRESAPAEARVLASVEPSQPAVQSVPPVEEPELDEPGDDEAGSEKHDGRHDRGHGKRH